MQGVNKGTTSPFCSTKVVWFFLKKNIPYQYSVQIINTSEINFYINVETFLVNCYIQKLLNPVQPPLEITPPPRENIQRRLRYSNILRVFSDFF